MKKLLTTLFILCTATIATAQIERPKLIVGLVVDQMRWDYLYYYYNQFGNGGLRRLVDEGYSCENNMINYVPTVTAIGHASIYTGSTPSLHGISGNNFVLDGKRTYCCADSTVRSIGSDGKAGLMSPRNMLASTIGDELKIATDFRARVFGVALKDRAAILPAGHSADAAYWYDNEAGHFITSSYYMDKLPKWMQQFNKANATKPGVDMKMSPDGVSLTFKLAEAIIDNEKIGTGDVTDMLAISISSTDAIGHTYGTRVPETREAYMRLDKDLARFLQKLDKKFGHDGYLLFLTADHGAQHNHNYMKQHKIPAGGWDGAGVRKAVNDYLKTVFNTDKELVLTNVDYSLYLDKKVIKESGIDYNKVKKAAIDLLKQDKQYAYVVDCDDATNAPVPQLIRERIVNGYNRMRNGEIMLVLQPQHFWSSTASDYKGTSHGTWSPNDAHIPLVFFGWHIKHGATSTPTNIVDIAPTVCSMLHIPAPNACIGNAILPVVENK